MISQLTGLLEEKNTHSVLLDVHGVGYELEVPLSTAFALPERGEKIRLFTHFVVREDAQALFGFLQRRDRDMFRTLIKVNGIGPKLGVTLLSGLDCDALTRCVLDEDVSTLVKVPGIGKKTAERLLIELRDKVKTFAVDAHATEPARGTIDLPLAQSIDEEAESALIALGYKPQDATKAIKMVRVEGQTLEMLIKAALKNML